MSKFLELNNISKTFETNQKLRVIKNLSYNFNDYDYLISILPEGFEFDWTSEAAMSKSRSMFRSVAALAEEFSNQSEA